MITEYFIPKGTAILVEQLMINKQGAKTDDSHLPTSNMRLLLDKYVKSSVIDKQDDNKGDKRSSWLQGVVKKFNSSDTELARASYHRWRCYTSALDAKFFSGKIDWRMVVGLGGNSVLETDLTLHHLYGLPIIPGSALKGLARAYATAIAKASKKATSIQPAPTDTINSQDIERIFGSQDNAGTVTFFDAYPEDGQVKFVVDIMNPHYPKYYQNQVAPTNDQNPKPITFLAVEKATFVFALAHRHQIENSKDVELALEWLQKALQKYGVGGKTSAGYGYFKDYRSLLALTEEEYRQPEKAPVVYIRPNISKLAVGARIEGTVIQPTDELRQIVPEAKAFLQYLEVPIKDVIIAVAAEESISWINKQFCVFDREVACGSRTVLICHPAPPKKTKNKNKK